MRLVLLGAPGSGKGTQAARLKEYLNVPHISTGELLRAAVTAGTPLGLQAKEVMEAGGLVSDEVVLGMLEERLLKPDTGPGFILDGYPRNLAQAEGRADDSPESVRKRLGVYESQTAPVVDFYRNEGKLAHLDGVGSLDEVFTRITEALAGTPDVG